MLAQLDVVDVRAGAGLEDEDEFVTRTIQGAKTWIVLDPDRDVLQLREGLLADHQHILAVPPVHANKDQRAVPAVTGQKRTRPAEEAAELLRRHLTGGLREIAMLDLALAGHVALDPHIEG